MGWRDAVRAAGDWLTVAPQRELARAPRRPAIFRFDGYAPVDKVITEMWNGAGRVSQAEALSVPGVLRARNIIAGGLATWPLVQRDLDNRASRNPFLEQIDPQVINAVTLAQTLQDLLFEGISWWRVTRVDRDGFPVAAEHLDFTSVSINPPGDHRSRAPLPSGVDPRRGTIWVDGVQQDPRWIKRFDSPNPGVLTTCGGIIKLAAQYGVTSQKYADNPRMQDFFTPADSSVDPLEGDDDVADLLSDWEEMRRKGVTGYVPAALKYNTAEQMTPADQQLAQLQELATKHVATALGLDAEDLNVSTTSRTYANDSDRRQDRINDTLQAYITALTQRLSMPDITRRGKRVVARADTYMRADPVTRGQFAQTMFNLVDPVTGKRALSIDEIREVEELPPAEPGPVPAQPAGSNVVPIRTGGSGAGTSRLAASVEGVEGRPAVTFADDRATFIAEPVHAAFTVDLARRIIRGLALPYGPTDIARKNGRYYRFEQGAIEWPADLSRVKLLVDHVMSSSVGSTFELDDAPGGITAAFKVGSGPTGDQVLAWAAEKVRDGLSVGVDFDHDTDTVPDPLNPGAFLVKRATGVEISIVAMPAFDRARVATVVASRDGGNMHCLTCGTNHAPGVACPTTGPPTGPPASPPPAATPTPPMTFSFEQVQALLANPAALAAAPQTFAVQHDQAATVDPLHRPVPGQPGTAVTHVTRPEAPYRFDRTGNLMPGPDHDFSADLVRAMRDGDKEAEQRALGFMHEMTAGERYNFADVDRADLAGLNPISQRPDLYVDQRDYAYPLTRATRRGTLNDITAFILPKFNSATGLVAAHTEGVEPASGTFTVTTQTITPTAKSGAIDMTREAWDQGGNPAASAIIWRQFTRTWNEALETGVATFLNTLTAAADITLTAGATNKALAKAWRTAVARLQFARGGAEQFDLMAAEQELYVAMATAETDDGEPIYPMIGATNRDGTAQRRFRSLEADGVEISPAWALASTAGAPNNSWLADSTTVHTWDTGPQRLEFAGIDSSGNYAPVAMVRLACWGYQALANTDINGVRQVIYDTVA